jgi:hypothetical protein
MKTDPQARTEDAPDESAAPAAANVTGNVADLRARLGSGNVEELMEVAKQARSVHQDLALAYQAYRQAMALGSPDAAYAAALFELQGRQGTPEQGLVSLRAAADAGHILGRVYLGNLYDLGAKPLGLVRDEEKANLWYRSAARSADVDPDDHEALARLGCGRFIEGSIEESEREAVLKKARGLGYRAAQASTPSDAGPTETPAPVEAGAPMALEGVAHKPAGKALEKLDKKQAEAREAERALPSPWPGRIAAGFTAFLYAVLFFGVAAGLSVAFHELLQEVIKRGVDAGWLADNPEAILPATLAIFGVLPSLIVYRGRVVLLASVFGTGMAFVGYVVSISGQLAILPWKEQIALFFAGGFLGAAFVLGLLGGAKRKPTKREATI